MEPEDLVIQVLYKGAPPSILYLVRFSQFRKGLDRMPSDNIDRLDRIEALLEQTVQLVSSNARSIQAIGTTIEDNRAELEETELQLRVDLNQTARQTDQRFQSMLEAQKETNRQMQALIDSQQVNNREHQAFREHFQSLLSQISSRLNDIWQLLESQEHV